MIVYLDMIKINVLLSSKRVVNSPDFTSVIFPLKLSKIKTKEKEKQKSPLPESRRSM